MTAPNTPGLTIYRELEQKSPEWLQARAGIITASVVGNLITRSTPDATTTTCPECDAGAGNPCVNLRGGKPMKTLHAGRTAQTRDLPKALTVSNGDTANSRRMTLIAERITGHVEDTPMTADMWRGVEEEPLARELYTTTHAPVEEVGFMVRTFDGYAIGCSPDGLVGDTGMIEIKSRNHRRQVRDVILGRIPTENMAQLQCALLVSGREWIDFISYSSGMPMWVKRVHPDPDWFAAIHAAASHFEDEARTTIRDYEEATVGLPVADITPTYDEIKV